MSTNHIKLTVVIILLLLTYTFVGTGTRVDDIKQEAPSAINERNWEILRYEGYQYGAWSNHGGKVWYHVKDTEHRNTYYRVYITKWGGELHFTYGEPEKMNRINLDNANGEAALILKQGN